MKTTFPLFCVLLLFCSVTYANTAIAYPDEEASYQPYHIGEQPQDDLCNTSHPGVVSRFFSWCVKKVGACLDLYVYGIIFFLVWLHRYQILACLPADLLDEALGKAKDKLEPISRMTQDTCNKLKDKVMSLVKT